MSPEYAGKRSCAIYDTVQVGSFHVTLGSCSPVAHASGYETRETCRAVQIHGGQTVTVPTIQMRPGGLDRCAPWRIRHVGSHQMIVVHSLGRYIGCHNIIVGTLKEARCRAPQEQPKVHNRYCTAGAYFAIYANRPFRARFNSFGAMFGTPCSAERATIGGDHTLCPLLSFLIPKQSQ